MLGAQLALAVVFVTAGVGKLLDLRGARASLAAFGVPDGVAAVLAPLLISAELAIAVALIPVSTARWGAIAATVLLLAFSVGIANAMRQGRTPNCNCFGNLHAAPAGAKTLARNLGLAVVAGLVAWRGPEVGIGDWLGLGALPSLRPWAWGNRPGAGWLRVVAPVGEPQAQAWTRPRPGGPPGQAGRRGRAARWNTCA